MNNISNNKKYSLLNKQLTSRLLTYLLIIITNNLISGQSFAGIIFKEYKKYHIRKISYDKILTPFKAAKIIEFVENGYFISGESHLKYATIQCFYCGISIWAALDDECLDSRFFHLDACKFSKISSFFKGGDIVGSGLNL